MAASNTVDIEVNLKGAEAAKKGLNSIGESAGQIAQKFDQTNSHLGEGLSSLTGNVEEMVGSFGELGGAIKQVGKTGAKGLLFMLPAVGGVIAAGMALYETFNMITGAAQRAEDAEEAMAAAASDLQSKLEALAEKGVIPTAQELYKFMKLNIDAQIAKEKLQKSIEKLTRSEQKARESSEKIIQLEKEKIKLHEEANKVKKEGDFLAQKAVHIMTKELIVSQNLEKAKVDQAQAQHNYNTQLRALIPIQEEVERKIRASATAEKEFEDRSAESTLGRVKELSARLQNIKVMSAEVILEGNLLELRKESIDKENKLLAIQVERIKKNAPELRAIEQRLKAQLAIYNEEAVVRANSVAKQADIRKKAAEEEEAENKKRYEAYKARAQRRLIEDNQIRMLEIEQMRLQGASIEEVLQARYEAEIKLAGNNAQRKLAIDLRYENERLRIQQAADQQAERQAEQERKRAEQEQKRAEQERQRLEAHRRSFMLESQAFDVSMMEDGLDKELASLELKYRKELELKERTEAEKTELTRRFNIEREAIEKSSVNKQIEHVAELTRSLGSGLADSTYAALVFGDSFQESIAKVIGSLGQQAAIESLIELAKGIAATFVNPVAASTHFAAAAKFGAAATAAGLASAALGGGGGGGGGAAAAASVSPLGSPQEAPEVEREQARDTQMVFNINFGGAVIYDTKASAEQALADRITNLQNTPRRGAPRRR